MPDRTYMIELKEDTEMRNVANDGLYPWSKKWSEPSFKVIPAGTKVNYRYEVFHDHVSHKVSFKDEEGLFALTRKIINIAKDNGDKKIGDEFYSSYGSPAVGGGVLYKITCIKDGYLFGYIKKESSPVVLNP